MLKKLVFGLTTFTAAMLAAAPAFAQGEAVAHAGGSGLVALAAGLCMGIAAFGGALGQGRAAGAALEGIARNPSAAGSIQTAMIIALALIESLVIYGLVIAFFIQGKI